MKTWVVQEVSNPKNMTNSSSEWFIFLKKLLGFEVD